MTARPLLPGMTLTPEHARQLEALVKTLSPDEALWISGYLASFARHAVQPVPDPVQPALLILHGSETGHGAGLARLAEKKAAAGGLTARNVAMVDFRTQELHEVRQLLVIASTHGDGEPPPAAVDFYDFIMGRKAPRLEGLKFAVLGLGDSTYERFCQTGKDLDQRLEALGAQRIHNRADCDVDYEAKADAWLDEVLELFGRETPARAAPVVGPTVPVESVQFDAHHPFAATLLENLVLNGRGSEKETRHIELSLAGSGLVWEPGDSLAILPENDPALVAELLAALNLRPDQPLVGEGKEIPLAEALTRRFEITTLTPGFVAAYGEAADAAPLRALALPEKHGELRQHMAGRQLMDVVAEFPAQGLDGNAFVAMLRKMQPRLYSLASSPAAYPEEAHLTVAVVRYLSHGRKRQGLASAYLADRLGSDGDGKVPVYVSSNGNFRLPADDSTSIIMVGAGTGVAPFRAFLQEREARGAKGRNWLFFGERRLRTDFLYQVEWQRFLKDRLLTRMDVAFSRDQAEKIYVQHRLLEKGREVFAWLAEGACFYVCGDASHMAPDVHRALAAIVAREGRMDAESAEEYLKRLQRERRYQRDVY